MSVCRSSSMQRARFTLHPLVLAVHVAIAALAVNVMTPQAVLAADTSAVSNVKPYQIAAGPLTAVLGRFAAEAGVALSFDPGLTADRQSPGLQGVYSIDAGFVVLLGGTGLQAEKRQGGGYTLRREPVAQNAVTLPTVQVAAALVDGLTEGSQSYAANGAGIGSKTPRSLREVPQSVSVVTRQRIEDQNVMNLNDALGATTGITLMTGSVGQPQFFSRGFEITAVQLDGGVPSNSNAVGFYGDYDFAQYDHLEVLRGADGLFAGTGEPGGAVNLVRKRPTTKQKASVALSLGSWKNRRVEADVNLPALADGRLRSRFVAVKEDKGYFYRTAKSEKDFLYGIVEWDVTNDTQLSIGGSYERRDTIPWWNGLPRYSDGRDLGLPRETFLATSWSTWDFRTSEIFARLDHQFNSDWSLRFNVSRIKQDSELLMGQASGAIDAVTNSGASLSGAHRSYSKLMQMADITLSGAVEAFGRRHELSAGMDWSYSTSPGYYMNSGGYPAGARPPVDIFNFDPHAWINPGSGTLSSTWDKLMSKQVGAYAVARLQLSDPLRLIIGTRLSKYEYAQIYRNYNAAGVMTGPFVRTNNDSSILTPYGGVTYDINDKWTAYGSYAQTYKAQGASLEGPPPGTPLEPIKGTNYELGFKGELMDKRLTTSVALYRIERKNEAVRDPNFPLTGTAGLDQCCFVSLGEVVSQGVDIEINGEIRPGWQISAGYTYNENDNKQTGTGRYHTRTPAHLFRLWTNASLPGEWKNWSVGGGVSVQSSNYVNGTVTDYDETTTPWTPLGSKSYSFSQPGYAVWNLRTEYRISPQWTAALNINNVFDKSYYQTVGSSTSGNWYGTPRSAMLTLRGTFQ